MSGNDPKTRKPAVGAQALNASRAGDHNERLVLQAIRTKGVATGAEIAVHTGLTHQAVLNIIKRLTADELVVSDGKVMGQRGQPAARVRLNPDGAFSIGLNVDRDHLILVVVDLVGQVRHRAYQHIAYPLPRDVIEFVLQQTKRVFEDRIVDQHKVLGLGVAMPDGIWHEMNDQTPDAYKQWKSIDIVEMCSQLLGLPVFSENDASASAIGEQQLGKGGEYDTFLYLVISAGLGCGVVINGAPYIRGKNHAGEIGNIPIDLQDRASAILWDVVSIFALYAVLEANGVKVSKPEDIREDDKKVSRAVDKWIEAAVPKMIPPFLTINYLLSPQIVFVGGHLPEFIVDRLCVKLNDAIEKHRKLMPVTHFVRSTTSLDAAALGASTLVFSAKLVP